MRPTSTTPAPNSPTDRPVFVLTEARLKVLRSAYEDAGETMPTGAAALARIAGALTRRDDPTLGDALYEALMSGFTPAGLAKVVAPAAAVYAGVDSAPRFNKTLGRVIGCLDAVLDASPPAVRDALTKALVHQKLVPGAGAVSLTELELQAIRADYDDEAFKKGGAEAVCGAGDVMTPFTKFMNRTVFNDDGHDPVEATRRREAMILAILATKGDVQALAIHGYVALGVGLSPDEVREILRAVEPPASAKVALDVFDAVLAILKPIVASQGPIMRPALGTILRTFLD